METLFRCTRCKLLFGWEGIPELCPACRRQSMIPPRIEVDGRDLTEFVMREYGRRDGLLDPKLRQGLSGARMGICSHGWIAAAICTECV